MGWLSRSFSTLQSVLGKELIEAAARGECDQIQLRLAAGADVHHKAEPSGSTALHAASYYGHAEAAQLLVSKGATLEEKDQRGCTPLAVACQNGQAEVVRVLLEKGANVDERDRRGRTTFHLAVENCHDERRIPVLIELLRHVKTQKGDSAVHQMLQTTAYNTNDMTALHLAAVYGKDRAVPVLVEAGADLHSCTKVKSSTPLHLACSNRSWAVVRLLLAAGANRTALDCDGRTPWERLPADSHVDVEAEAVLPLLRPPILVDHAPPASSSSLSTSSGGSSSQDSAYQMIQRQGALFEATWAGELETIRGLFANGVQVNYKGNNKGATPLIIASQEGHLQVAQLFLEKGARVDECAYNGWNALHIASQNGHAAVMKALIEHMRTLQGDQALHRWIECATRDQDGMTALHIAAAKGQDEAVSVLVDAGAKLHSRTTVKRYTPLHLACAHSEWDIVQLLLFSGASIDVVDNNGKTPWDRVPTESRLDDSLAPYLELLRPSNATAVDSATPSASETQQPVKDCRQSLKFALHNPGSTEPVPLTIEYVQTCIDHFSPHRILGRGAFGQVYLGHDPELDLNMAVKKVSLRILSQSALDAVKQSFRREIAALRRFRHPNIVVLYGYNLQLDAEDHFLVYEYVSRGSLDRFLLDDTGRALLSGALRRLNILYEVAQAIHFLHTGGCGGLKVMHRDLKPGNICLTESFSAKLIDCGVAKFVQTNSEDNHSTDQTILLSSMFAVFGTKGYICPAFLLGQIDDYVEACDIYSFGVMMAEMVVGCLQANLPKQGEVSSGTFFQMYVSNHQEPIIDGWKLLMEAADTSAFEWNAEALELVCKTAISCMSPAPDKRLSSANLISELGEAVQLQFDADNPIVESEPSLLGDEARMLWSERPSQSAGQVPCVVCNKKLEGVICGSGHSICSPCMSAGMMFQAGRLGCVRCPLEGCQSDPFSDAELYGKVTLRAFEVYMGSRDGQQLIDERLKGIEEVLYDIKKSQDDGFMNLNRSVEGIDGKLSSGLRQCLRAMASFSSETFKSCPGLVWLVPDESSVSSRNPLEWAARAGKKKYLLYFICQHSFTEVQPPLEIKVSRKWLCDVAPVLKLGLFVIRAAAISYGLPLPFGPSSHIQQIELEQMFINTLLDPSTQNLLDSSLANGGKFEPGSDPHVHALVGKAYEFIAQKAREAKNTGWKKSMVPAINQDGTTIWIKAEYMGEYENNNNDHGNSSSGPATSRENGGDCRAEI